MFLRSPVGAAVGVGEMCELKLVARKCYGGTPCWMEQSTRSHSKTLTAAPADDPGGTGDTHAAMRRSLRYM